MELAIGLTLYLSFGAWLVLPHLGAPEIFGRLCIGLCASEFVAATAYGMTESALWGSIAGTQIPVAAASVGVLSFAYGVFVVRGW
jgi:hypothetical protein